MALVIQDIKDFLGDVVSDVSDTQLEYYLGLSASYIQESCQEDVMVVSYWIACQLTKNSIINDANVGIKRKGIGKKIEIEYNIRSSTNVTDSLYCIWFKEAYSQCLVKNGLLFRVGKVVGCDK